METDSIGFVKTIGNVEQSAERDQKRKIRWTTMKENRDLGFEKAETKKQSIGFVICEKRETR